jgi:2-keto-4-pentenoate hydratase
MFLEQAACRVYQKSRNMMADDLVDIWVDGLVAARATSGRFTPSVNKPSTRDETYQIQAGVAQRVGPVGGFKTARKGEAIPIMAPIFAADIVRSGAQVAVTDMVGIELEVGLEIVGDCPADPGSLTLAELSTLLRPVAVIELVDTRVQGPFAEDEFVKLTDNQINAGLVVGAAATDWSGSDFGHVEARMQAGADILLDGQTSVLGGSALETFIGFARQIGDHCGGLQRGHIVITGSLHPLVYYPKGTLVEGWIDGIGSVSVTLGA